ncbi:fungal-specific transcription factor domain-containing protein [Dichotomopilus funicola]|uniref:Fungal-specific transcription factor domain-containing protein n=1 Tax=Dichotomopilus funicola TaxID=1934379 RepID=A0AAN6V1Y3_9PEZI|nr:fungal-specific transcription factor domain-containing protein [Dichotomopilus funicola]
MLGSLPRCALASHNPQSASSTGDWLWEFVESEAGPTDCTESSCLRLRLRLLSCPRGSHCEARPVVTIASHLRIQSILSPPEPPDSPSAAGSPSFDQQHPQQPTPKRKFHDAFTAPAPDAPIDPADQPPRPPHSQSLPQRLPNIRQPLPRSPPRPATVAAVRTQGHAHAHAPIAAAPDDDSRSPAQGSMMAGSPGSPGGGGGVGGGVDSKKGFKRTPLRSSIACQRCRKSKIKCNNTGGDQPCETCIRNGKECTYPEVTPAPPKRSEPSSGAKMEQGSERKRLRRIEDIVKMEGTAPATVAEDVLSAPYLTETVWNQLFDIYRLHFATELPFLHLATLKEKLGNRFRAKPADTSPEINLVLLGILTLTARFHNTLVSYITAPRNSPSVSGVPKPRSTGPSSEASSASEYYADVLTKALGGLRTSMTVASVERVQAFLMLGLYEWSQARPRVGGMAAWMYVGVAIRMAQALGLGDGDKEPNKIFRARPAKPTPQNMTPTQRITAKEIRRRTMFSCLILDRLLGCGKDRVSTIRSEDLQIQLPCAEVSFDLSDDVYTGFLKPLSGAETSRPISDSVLGRFVRLVDLWGEISKWSFSGGRFTEAHPPWSREATFFRLREKLEEFYENLPDHFRWSDSNYYKHENHQASSVYVSLHMLGAVCRIMLHREYIPFIPIVCEGPDGPLDEPTFESGQEPPGFWEDSAEEIFRAAKDIVDLAEICRDKLPMSSLVLFAVWTAAFVGIYAVHFPQIDTKGHMLPKDEPNGPLDVTKHGPTGLTYKLLTHMSLWLKLAETYVGYFSEMDRYYDTVKQDYERHVGGGRGGGGLEEWKERAFKVVNNGEILVLDEGKSSSRDSTAEPGSSVGPDSGINPLDHHAKTPRSTSMSFTPINTQASSSSHPNNHHPIDPTSDVAAEAAASTLWRIQQPHAQHHPHPHHQQHAQQPSPSQSSAAVPSPQMQHHQPQQTQPQQQPQQQQQTHPHPSAKLPPYISNEIAMYVEQNQSMPWTLAPGGPDQFAHGTEDLVPMDNGNIFWGSLSGGGGDGGGVGVVMTHVAGYY